jgi:hypothetical protein
MPSALLFVSMPATPSHDVTVPLGATTRSMVESENHTLPKASEAMA